MRKLFTIIAIMLVAVVVAGPALAAVQNVRVSGSIDNTYLFRKNFDFGDESSGDEKTNLFFTQAILRVDADLTDQVGATIALINERPWELDPGEDQADIAIQLAFVTLREMLYSPLTLVIGRQQFSYGNALIIDATGPNNTAQAESGLQGVANDLTKMSAMDAIRAILDYNPLTLEILYAQISESGADYINDTDDILAGVNANYQLGDEMDSVVEAYFWKFVQKTATSGLKADNTYTIGGRVSTNPFEGLNLQVENAYQKGTFNGFGSSNHARRDAWIVQFISNYQLPVWDEYNPTLQYVYTKATGNAEGSGDTGHYTAWNPLFENQSGGKIYNALFNLTNFEVHQFTVGFNPMEDLLTKITVAGVWLERNLREAAEGGFSLVQPSGDTVSLDSTDIKPDNTYLGKEIDLELIYDYTEDVQIAGNFGWFIPGSFFRAPDDQTAKQAIVNVNVAF